MLLDSYRSVLKKLSSQVTTKFTQNKLSYRIKIRMLSQLKELYPTVTSCYKYNWPLKQWDK